MHDAMVKTVQFLKYGADTPETLIIQQFRKIAPKANWYCDFKFCNVDCTEPTELL
jgi:hypothetical protein